MDSNKTYYIYNPNKWIKIIEGRNVSYENDVIYMMEIGVTYDDNLDLPPVPIIEMISKEVYEKILNNEYKIVKIDNSIYPFEIKYNDESIPPIKKNNPNKMLKKI